MTGVNGHQSPTVRSPSGRTSKESVLDGLQQWTGMLEEVRRLGRGTATLGRLEGFAAEALMLFGAGEVEEAVTVAGRSGRDDPLLYHLSQWQIAEAAKDFVLARAAAGAGQV